MMRLVRWGKPEIVLEEFPSILKELACPALVIHGSRDILPESFAQRAAGLIANSHLIALNSGHFIPLEQAAQVSRHLATFFKSRRVEHDADRDLEQSAQRLRPRNEVPCPEMDLVPHPVV